MIKQKRRKEKKIRTDKNSIIGTYLLGVTIE